MSHVHSKGVVHRDLKPENVLIDSGNGRLVLADFGIAHFKDSSLTTQADLLVNRNYLAPEQMSNSNVLNVGPPADIFALGLIFTEVFTRQNSRGTQYSRVSDRYPFLSDLDLLVERMTLQDHTQRMSINSVRDSLLLLQRQRRSNVEEIVTELSGAKGSGAGDSMTNRILHRAAEDVLSAKYIFERSTDAEFSRYNLNYHCEISYGASEELYNACVLSEIYSMCKSKFEYEGQGSWGAEELAMVTSQAKSELLRDFEVLLGSYPLPPDSVWDMLPRMAAHYFRFCKDYHCEELMLSIGEMLSDSGPGSIRQDLLNAPIIWLAKSARGYLSTDLFEMTPSNREQVEFERQVRVCWEETLVDDPHRIAVGAELFDQSYEAESVAHVLEVFEKAWNVSSGQRVDGTYAIHFRSRDEYQRFRAESLAIAAPHYVFEGDVLALLRTDAEYDDLVALSWEPTFDIRITLAKVLGLREIRASTGQVL